MEIVCIEPERGKVIVTTDEGVKYTRFMREAIQDKWMDNNSVIPIATSQKLEALFRKCLNYEIVSKVTGMEKKEVSECVGDGISLENIIGACEKEEGSQEIHSKLVKEVYNKKKRKQKANNNSPKYKKKKTNSSSQFEFSNKRRKKGNINAKYSQDGRGLFPISEAADLIGLKHATLKAYIERGVPSSHLSEKQKEKLKGCLSYDRENERIEIKSYQKRENASHYLDEKTVEYLMELNWPVINEWIKISEFVEEKMDYSRNSKEFEKVCKQVKHLCSKSKIRASKGLSERLWYLDPSQNREYFESIIIKGIDMFGEEAIDFFQDYIERRNYNKKRAEKRRNKN